MMMQPMTFARDNIQRLHAYTPGEQPRADASGAVVKLNTNENPYPPSEAVMRAITDVTAEDLRRYPPPLAQPFRERAAEVHGLQPDEVIGDQRRR